MPRMKHPVPVPCEVPGCGRPAYVLRLCQSHHRHSLKRTPGSTEPLPAIRPYRKRTDGTVKFAGLRLSRLCVARLRKKARKRGLSNGAAIADVLEAWANRSARRSRR